MEGTTNLPILYISWWYGYAYDRLFKYLRAIYIVAFDRFSVKTCLATIFSPWKRDSISYDGLSLQQKFQVWTLNIASRFTGFIIKSITLFSFVVIVALITICAFLAVIIWPFIPVIAIYMITRGILTL